MQDSVYHMTLYMDLIAYKINIISARKHITDMDVAYNVMSMHKSITCVVIQFL